MKKIIITVIVLSLFLGATSLYAATLTRLGTHPFYKAKDLKAQEVYKIVKANADKVKDGFIKARALDLYGPFMAQLESANLEEIQVQPKETLLWMIFKKKNKAYLLRDVVWKGKKPFVAYRFVVNHGEQAHEFIFPKVCMNIALRSITPVAKKPIAKKVVPPPVKKTAPPAAVPVVKKNEQPHCDIKAAPRRLFTGNIATLDASDSHDPDGKIESIKLALTNRSDNTVEEIVLSKAPFIYEANMKKSGDYEIRATVRDDRGASESCVVDVKVLKRGFFVADVGVLKQFDPATWMPIKVGYMYKIKENLAVTGLVGPAPLVSGDDDRPATIGDIFLSYYVSNFFLGGGAGVFHTSNKTRADLIVDTGYQITNNDNGPNISIYVQGRSAVDQFDNISKYGRLGAGLRVHF